MESRPIIGPKAKAQGPGGLVINRRRAVIGGIKERPGPITQLASRIGRQVILQGGPEVAAKEA